MPTFERVLTAVLLIAVTVSLAVMVWLPLEHAAAKVTAPVAAVDR